MSVLTTADWSARFATVLPSILSAPPAPASPAPTAPTPAFAATIDHTLLKPAATPAEVATICSEALAHRFASVCVNSGFAPQVAAALASSGVRTCVVVGFPLGAMAPEAKALYAASSPSAARADPPAARPRTPSPPAQRRSTPCSRSA